MLPLAIVATVAFVAGILLGARHDPADRRTAERFLRAWDRGDYGAMYGLLSGAARKDVSARGFARTYRSAAETATLLDVIPGRLRGAGDGRFTAPVQAVTKRFGTLRATVLLTVDATGADPPGVTWERRLAFPGLRAGERLARTVEMPPRAELQARDGRVIATGPDRTSDLGPLAAEIAGRTGPIPADSADTYARLGYPPDATVGLTGLERQFEQRLAGTFGGTLRAGSRLLARVQPRAAGAVRTSIDLDIEAAAVTALAGRLGGIAVLRPRSGEVLALAGIAYSAPQPPGSTFKIVTLSGALDARVARAKSTYPVESSTTLSGVKLENANGESCGGSIGASFAASCNSVFAPLGARLGPRRLVAAAERFGFNTPDGIVGAPPGSIPAAAEIGDDLAVGSTAIGQGRVTSTPLRMAEVAAAIANEGELVRPTLLRGGQGQRSRATSPHTARIVRRYMKRVVESGTGSAAAIPGVSVAGKTGTAELRTTVPDAVVIAPPGAAQPQPQANDITDTDAWFVAFAPAGRPAVAVAVLLVGQGAGGATAAPAAKTVLQAALGR
ncbi:MAG: penicillin-binding protein [Solirubrobacteraceae bacterium]|nr:penicillin-binding protein [Solirubrobacteraceae bacterium]